MVMGVARVALALAKLPLAKLVETVPVTVPRVVTPWRTDTARGKYFNHS